MEKIAMSQLKSLLGTLDGVLRYVGIGLMVLGVVACVAPLTSGLAIAVIVGLVLLAAAALVALFGVRAREAGDLFLIIGGVAAICGLVLIVQPSAGLSVVRWILIAYMLISGASEAALAWRLRPDDGWAETLASAVVSILAALVLWSDWPISGARAIGLLVGGTLISSGWAIMRAHRALESAGGRLRSARDAFASRSIS
jgi:uncharacterized membrane protein HdeD (DUF308 family)